MKSLDNQPKLNGLLGALNDLATISLERSTMSKTQVTIVVAAYIAVFTLMFFMIEWISRFQWVRAMMAFNVLIIYYVVISAYQPTNKQSIPNADN